MKKLFAIFVIFLCSINPTLADMNLSCVMTNWNTNEDYDKDPYNIEYKELSPSRFSVIIEVTSPGKVIGRLIGTSETGNMRSPYVGTMDDNKIKMNHKAFEINERGSDFILDLISGMFENETYIGQHKYWYVQRTGTCRLVK